MPWAASANPPPPSRAPRNPNKKQSRVSVVAVYALTLNFDVSVFDATELPIVVIDDWRLFDSFARSRAGTAALQTVDVHAGQVVTGQRRTMPDGALRFIERVLATQCRCRSTRRC